jgi:NAD(P)-dependent dehydrogenase (short-subunit alcohol dehydrogenase family)
MSEFAQQVILITGAASGIGREMVQQLLREGARVAGVDHREDALAALEAELQHPDFTWAVANVTDRPALLAAVQQLEERLGPVDRLIACAGVSFATPGDSFSSADFERMVRVNLIGVANTLEAVLPGMIQRRRGHVVAISTLASLRGMPKWAAYSASKAGLNAMFDSLRMDLRRHGISVTTICPGWIHTPLIASVKGLLPRALPVDEAVRRMLTAVRRRRRFCAFPRPYSTALRLLRCVPASLSDWCLRKFYW